MFGFVGNVDAIGCPAGSLRGEGADVKSISECNIAQEHAGSNDLMGTINIAINVVLGVLGLLAVIVIIYGGFMYTTSAGDASKIKKSQRHDYVWRGRFSNCPTSICYRELCSIKHL